MGTYVYTISAKTVPGVMIDGEQVFTSNFAGKPSYWRDSNGFINKKCSFAESIHARNGTKPKVFTTSSTSDIVNESWEHAVYRVNHEDGITSYSDGNLGNYPEFIGIIVRDGKTFRFVNIPAKKYE